MGKSKKQRKQFERRLRELIEVAESAAARAEKAARKATRERRRAERSAPAVTESPSPAVASTLAGESFTKAELLEQARRSGVVGRGRMSKAELVAALHV